MKPTFFSSQAEFHKWLAEHHASKTQLLVGFFKKKSGRGITYPEALDEALAFGWIDGVRKRIDENAYTIRFTPRKPGSFWSVVNTKRVEELIALGRMQPAGLLEFHNRDQEKTRRYSYEREHQQLDRTMEAALRSNKKAAAFFEAQPLGYRKIATFWVMSAKKEETRARRLAHLIECSSAACRIDMLKPRKK